MVEPSRPCKRMMLAISLWFLIGLTRVMANEGPSVDYRGDIEPLLRARCYACHGESKREAGLRLDSVQAMLEGGDTGVAVVAGKSGESLLIQAVEGGTDEIASMPPEGPPLDAEPIAVLRAWIDRDLTALPVADDKPASDADEDAPVAMAGSAWAKHWSFQPLRRPPLPRPRDADRVRTAIDTFWLDALDRQDIPPSEEASRETWLRRVSLDLLGLPPTRDDMVAFLGDSRPDAYERVVDRLLASPAYGERWGRHWLDVARYADSNGYTRDSTREMYLYRDWVIGAINGDLSFDQFTIEQLAGDLLPEPTVDQLLATGFHRNTLTNEEGGTDDEQFRVDAVADRVATTGEVFLGLTLGCARCHSHKYDPISQREYYQLFAFFNNCDEPSLEVPEARQTLNGELARRDQIRQQIAQLEAELQKRHEEWDAARWAWEKSLAPAQRIALSTPIQDALQKKPGERSADETKLVDGAFQITEGARKQFAEVDQIAQLRATEPKVPLGLILRRRELPRETHVHRRGDFLDLGRRVEPNVPEFLPALFESPLGDTHFEAAQPEVLPVNNQADDLASVVVPRGPDRLEFARWMVRRDNPLTARVQVNRIWQKFFGRGLVETENDFGLQGTLPSHPELLDWLAADWVDSGWSVKRLHRLIVLSSVYRQSSRFGRQDEGRDPNNVYLWRQRRLRLEAEIVRDNALAVSGLLTRKIGGRSVFPPQPDGVFEFTQDPKPWKTEVGEDRYRRGMYTHFWRSSPYPMLIAFDFPNSNVTCTARLRSNTPLQSLTVANDTQFIECARALSKQLMNWTESSDADRVHRLFEALFARRPVAAEHAVVIVTLANYRSHFAEHRSDAGLWIDEKSVTESMHVEQAAWAATIRALMNVDEFMTRE